MTIGKRIKQLRLASGMTMDRLGELFSSEEKPEGMTKQAVSAWEKDRNQLTANQIIRLCKIFDVNANDLLYENGAIPGNAHVEIKLTPEQIQWLALMQDLAPHDVAEFTEQIHARQVKNRAIFESLGSRVPPRIPMETTDFSGHAPSQKKEKSE